MRVLTHNMLCCIKCDNFPLKINATVKEEKEQEENLQFITKMLPRLEYPALLAAAQDLAIKGLPEKLPENIQENETALKALHKLLLEVHVKQGELVCTRCERAYPINDGIPNMILREDELNEKKKILKKAAAAAASSSSSTTTTTSSETTMEL